MSQQILQLGGVPWLTLHQVITSAFIEKKIIKLIFGHECAIRGIFFETAFQRIFIPSALKTYIFCLGLQTTINYKIYTTHSFEFTLNDSIFMYTIFDCIQNFGFSNIKSSFSLFYQTKRKTNISLRPMVFEISVPDQELISTQACFLVHN